MHTYEDKEWGVHLKFDYSSDPSELNVYRMVAYGFFSLNLAVLIVKSARAYVCWSEYESVWFEHIASIKMMEQYNSPLSLNYGISAY